ncbi:phosphonate C-P lyase system protein PhnH [Kiloniella antarctica]|uniref:Phosphonate C-P lyase system protein PhnH n=1 Tax=Kiloniella antarctica TaxID=1550907 RepID=A0ABW5BNV6_9PROT
MMKQTTLSGLQHPVFDSTAIFKAVLEAMSRPGEISNLPVSCPNPGKLNPTITAILLTLADMDTPVWLSPEMDTPEARTYLQFYTGCPIVEDPKDCLFAIVDGRIDPPSLSKLPLGSTENPDRSATILMSVSHLDTGTELTLRGPGIKNTNSFKPTPVNKEFWNWSQTNRTYFPRGIDVIFAAPSTMAALPRTTELEL